MSYDSAILIKVDKGTKEKMERLNVNWSEEIRKFIKSLLESEADKNLALAVATTDKFFRKAKSKGFESAVFIRKMRDERYGSGSD